MPSARSASRSLGYSTATSVARAIRQCLGPGIAAIVVRGRGPSLHPIGAMSGMRPRGLLGRRACLNRSPPRRELELDADEASRLAHSFAAPSWLQELGRTSWFLVGFFVLVAGLGWLLGATATIVGPVDRRGDRRDRRRRRSSARCSVITCHVPRALHSYCSHCRRDRRRDRDGRDRRDHGAERRDLAARERSRSRTSSRGRRAPASTSRGRPARRRACRRTCPPSSRR